MTRSRAFVAALLVAGAALAFVLRVSHEMVDFEVYWRGGARAAAVEPLYRADDGHYQFKYLPAFAVLAIPLGAMPLGAAKAAWFGISVALLVVLIWTSLALLPEQRKPTALLVATVVIVLGKFFAHELNLGQANVLFASMVTAAILAMRRRREAVAGVLIALTLAIKPYGVVFIPWVMARRTVASAAALLLTGAVVMLMPVVVYGFGGTAALYRAWWTVVTESTAGNLVNPDNVSFAGLSAKWLGTGSVATWTASLLSASALIAAVAIFRARRRVVFPEALEGSFLLLLVPLLSPQGWDYVLLLASPTVLLLANYEDRLPGGLRALTVLAALAIGLSVFDLMGRDLYAAFMNAGVVSVCAIVLGIALTTLRARTTA